MKNTVFDEGIRERLIIAGIKEIELHGLNDFSLRRVASMCSVSCAAPYRHFKNKDELVLGVISYINSGWDMMGEQIEKAFCGDTQKQLINLCVAIVRFFIANSNYISVMLPIKGGLTDEQQTEREKIWQRIERRLKQQAKERGLAAEKTEELEYLLKTLIFGTVMVLEELSAEECEKKLTFMRTELERIINS